MMEESGFCNSTVRNKIRWNTKYGKIDKTTNFIDPESNLEDKHSTNSFKRVNEIQYMLWIGHGLATKQVHKEKNKKIVALYAPNTYSLKERYHKKLSNDTSIIRKTLNNKKSPSADIPNRASDGLAWTDNRKKIIKKKIHPNSKDRFILEIKNLEPRVNLYRFNKKIYSFQNYLEDYSYQFYKS